MTAPQTLFIFVDGVGIGEDDPSLNPLKRGVCPELERLIAEESVPIDACLGVSGLPQSATGQATLFTGDNAAAAMGRHIEGFPPETLKQRIRGRSVFDQLQDRGYRCTFANGYYCDDVDYVYTHRRHSVSTVSTLSAFGTVRLKERLLRGRAVSHDLTREVLLARGYTGSIIAPEEAAAHLAGIARDYDFTLFEFFQTDLNGHRGGPDDVREVLGRLNTFLAALVPQLKDAGKLLVITSDHGNIEDCRTRTHTMNPVPFIACGEGADVVKRRVKSLTDVVPALLTLYPPKGEMNE